MTSLEQEKQENARWKLRDSFRGIRVFDQLVDKEFLTLEEQHKWTNNALQNVIRHAVLTVPYYRYLFEKLGLQTEDIRSPSDLPKLPLLGKREIYDHSRNLRSLRLPSGDHIVGTFSSSGTTGRPAKVVHTNRSNAMFSYLSHRQWRFMRADPDSKLATIRLASQIPKTKGRELADGRVKREPSWRYVGHFFHTGPSAYFNVTNPIEQQLEFLQNFQPAYVMSYPESLEHLAFASGTSLAGVDIAGVVAISEQMTAEMRQRIGRVFSTKICQTYGLNEIGLVAAMCDAGRYHVHTEHCVVELINEDNQPCRAGEIGQIVVTALNNSAMPLIRYDTDDLAEAVSAECPCGRTLPSFGRVYGRYSRIAYLPQETLWQVGIIREAIESNPDELAKNLRQYQIYQHRDKSFEVRLACKAPLPAQFTQNIWRKWVESGCGSIGLTFLLVDHIPRGPGGKYQEFDSEYYPRDSNDKVIRT